MELKFSISRFEGPLDLLLKLIGNKRISADEINVLDIASQYLKYFSENKMEIEETSEFLVMATTLLEIKSKTLLPSSKEEMYEAETMKKTLFSLLTEYEKYQSLSEKLRERETISLRQLAKNPVEIEFEESIDSILKKLTVEKLHYHYIELTTVVSEDKIPSQIAVISRDEYSLEDKVQEILGLLSNNKRLTLFVRGSIGEIVITFLAILQIVKSNIATVIDFTEENSFVISDRRSYNEFK